MTYLILSIDPISHLLLYNERDIATTRITNGHSTAVSGALVILRNVFKDLFFSMVDSYLLSSVLCVGAHLGFSLVCTSLPLLSTARHLQIVGDKAHRQSEPC